MHQLSNACHTSVLKVERARTSIHLKQNFGFLESLGGPQHPELTTWKLHRRTSLKDGVSQKRCCRGALTLGLMPNPDNEGENWFHCSFHLVMKPSLQPRKLFVLPLLWKTRFIVLYSADVSLLKSFNRFHSKLLYQFQQQKLISFHKKNKQKWRFMSHLILKKLIQGKQLC